MERPNLKKRWLIGLVAICLLVIAVTLATRFFNTASGVLGYLLVAFVIYWPIKLVLESSVSLVRRLMRK